MSGGPNLPHVWTMRSAGASRATLQRAPATARARLRPPAGPGPIPDVCPAAEKYASRRSTCAIHAKYGFQPQTSCVLGALRRVGGGTILAHTHTGTQTPGELWKEQFQRWELQKRRGQQHPKKTTEFQSGRQHGRRRRGGGRARGFNGCERPNFWQRNLIWRRGSSPPMLEGARTPPSCRSATSVRG